MSEYIPVAEPALIGNEKAYVLDCLESAWIARGKYIPCFEQAVADFCGARYAMSCCNGTAALHLALLALDIGPGDEIILPTLTYVATANAVTYCGARPVFVDSQPETCNLDPALLEDRITRRTRGIIAVHLYGHPVEMGPVLEVARRHNLFVIEDASEALGAEYCGQRVGSLASIATFSFHAAKVITTGEGGMVVCNDQAVARRVSQLKEQGMEPDRRYWFSITGYNYRMTNVAAAIGLAQIEKADWHISRRRENAACYRERLAGIPALTLLGEQPWAKHAYWMNNVLLTDHARLKRDDLIVALADKGIETWPFFYPLHTLPMYQSNDRFPVAESLAARGISLPSSARLSRADIEYVAETLITLLER